MGTNFGVPGHEEESIEAIDELISSQPLQHVVIDGKVLDLSSIDPNYGKPFTEDFQECLAAYVCIQNVIQGLREKNLVSNVGVLLDMLKLDLAVQDGSLTAGDIMKGKPFLTKEVSLFAQRFSNSDEDTQHFRFTSRLETDFKTLDTIGKGGYGVVVRAVNKIDHKEYAIKKIRTNRRGPIMREVQLLAKLDHENVNRYHSVWMDYEPIPEKSTESADHICSESETSSVISEKRNGFVLENNIFANEKGRVPQRVVTKGGNGSPINHSNSSSGSRDKFWAFGEDEKSDNSGKTVPKYVDGSPVNHSSSSSGSRDKFWAFGEDGKSESSGETDRNSLILCYNSKSGLNSNNVFRPRLPSLHRNFSFPFTNFHQYQLNQHLSPVRDQQVALVPPKCPELQEILCIQLELCETNLQEWLIKRNEISTSVTELTERDISTANNYIIQIYKGLEYLHSQNCIHRDIKTTNILLTNDLKVLKICDFGISKEIGKGNESMVSFRSSNTNFVHTSNIGSRQYTSPEQLRSTNYTCKTDLFSSALVFLELYHPFTTNNERAIVLEKARKSELAKEFEETFVFESTLILEMLNLDWEQRPNAGTVLKRWLHPRQDLVEENRQLKRRIAELEAQLKYLKQTEEAL